MSDMLEGHLKYSLLIENCVVTEFTKASFTPEWRRQDFPFCDLYGLEYGIVRLEVSLCLFQLVSLNQLSDFPAIKRLVTVSKIFDRAVFK